MSSWWQKNPTNVCNYVRKIVSFILNIEKETSLTELDEYIAVKSF